MNPVTTLRGEFMPVMPTSKWAFSLYVREKLVQSETNNLRLRPNSDGQEGKRAIGSEKPCAFARKTRRRKSPRSDYRDLLNLDSHPRRHNARQIHRVAKERKNLLKRSRNPLLELGVIWHAWYGTDEKRGPCFPQIFDRPLASPSEKFIIFSIRTISLNPTACGHLFG